MLDLTRFARDIEAASEQAARLLASVDFAAIARMQHDAERVMATLDRAGILKDISFAAAGARMLQEEQEREARMVRMMERPLVLDWSRPPSSNRRSIVRREVKRRIGFGPFD